jgi:hypothetical protein
MEEKELKEFSWTGLFIVTGLCFFGFSAILEFLDHTHPKIFIWIGLLSIFLGILNMISKLTTRSVTKKRNKIFSE